MTTALSIDPSSHANPHAAAVHLRAAPHPFAVVHGTFHLDGFAPDGDSIRFCPTHPHSLDALRGAAMLRASSDGSVQLRFQAIDATELHYAGHAQPLGAAARDELLRFLGFARFSLKDESAVIAECAPHVAYGAILCNAVDAHGRPIAYVLRACDAAALGTRTAVESIPDGLLADTANAHMLRIGLAYPLFYTSVDAGHRAQFRTLARGARERRAGVWANDATRTGVAIRTFESIGPRGAVIFPKLFRRAVDWLRARRDHGFRGGIGHWLEENPREDDRLVHADGSSARLSELVEHQGEVIWLNEDVAEVAFVGR